MKIFKERSLRKDQRSLFNKNIAPSSRQKLSLPKYITLQEIEELVGPSTVTKHLPRAKSKSFAEKHKASTPSPSHQGRTKTFFNRKSSATESDERLVPCPPSGDPDNLYTHRIQRLSSKLHLEKSRITELEEEFKQMEMRYTFEIIDLKRELEKSSSALKKIREEKFENESKLHEEILKYRKEIEEFRTDVNEYLESMRHTFEQNLMVNLNSEYEEAVSFLDLAHNK